jgi:hypothetical protein
LRRYAGSIFAVHNAYRSLDAYRVKEETENHHSVVADGRNGIDPDRFIQSGFIY